MDDLQKTEDELRFARRDLEQNLADLQEVVRDRLDVKQRARAVLERGRREAIVLGRQARAGAREHPGTAIAIGLVVLALIGGRIWLSYRRRSRRPGAAHGSVA